MLERRLVVKVVVVLGMIDTGMGKSLCSVLKK